jgi:hypothetical protein
VAGDEDDRLARNVGNEMEDALDFFEFAAATELVGDPIENNFH